MNSFINLKDLAFILVLTLLVSLVTYLTNPINALSFSLLTFFLLSVMFQIYRRTEKFLEKLYGRQEEHYQQIEALFSIYQYLKPEQIIPDMRNWAISPDLAKFLLSFHHQNKPVTVLECGSGLSTLFSAYAIKKNGQGHVWSLDHDPIFAEKTRVLLQEHGLTEFATVIDAPLISTELNNKNWQWYDLQKLPEIPPIDLLFIDGPPDLLRTKTRFPALPMLHSKLADKSTIILDDCIRPIEKENISEWCCLYPELSKEYYPHDEGTFVLTRSGNSIK